MKRKSVFLVMAAALFVFTLTGCNSKKKEAAPVEEKSAVVADVHNSRNSLDYEGTYTGTMPCADCSGIEVEITLTGDQYTRKRVYLGKEDNTFEDSGAYRWNDSGNIIILNDDSRDQYQVGENSLIALDEKGERITGDLADLYILRKQ
ncbi:putative lipoprotein NlpE involved in copper resistance [Parabacteroides sp. PFB2-10]|uniref:copper resistance protein NlpE n=1 Tax=Parabacteroides sp. PFB2-10 TaxID=1742405 RepID=UPI0024753F6A|nr:copper resistance protein NlpE [Parabacteroides sp. PFB2-10]MDH6313659.1 putative lipoprotein NlpE involved in copper resistance [Parabacteroides sp. PFB2-10]MDL2244712.1 copper resistance protein NlpE [Parabacteroides sp. OttesenSCG-928-J18]